MIRTLLPILIILSMSGCVFITDDEYLKRMQQADAAGSGAIPCVETQWFADTDGDGLGDPVGAEMACEAPTGTVDNGDDCDDTDAGVGLGPTWFKDVDADGYGDATDAIVDCVAPAGMVADSTDCDDADIGVHPGAVETCASNADDDCDGDRNDPDADDCTVFYVDGDSDGFGGAEGQCLCEAQAPFLVTSDTDCADADAEVNPEAPEICNNGQDDDCDGLPGACGLYGERSISEAEFRLVGTVSDGRAGSVVASGGDLTGDGAPDVLIGAYNSDGVRGRVYLVSMPTDAESDLDISKSWVGESDSDKLGRDVAFVGDLTGDGYVDLLMGAPQNDAGGDRRGKLYIVPGPIDELTDPLSDASATILGTTNFAYVGRNFDGAGDFDGDGNLDLLLGGIGHKSDGVGLGAGILVLGPLDGELDLSTSPDSAFIMLGEASGDSAGMDVLGIGDVDGDGLDDVAIGARTAGGMGRAYLVLGHTLDASTMDLADADAVVRGEQSGAEFGAAMARGDIDGDGTPDWVIAAPKHDTEDSESAGGMVVVVHAPAGVDGDASAVSGFTVGGTETDGNLGEGLAVLNDRDGDGADELAIGVPGALLGLGQVLVFYDAIDGAATDADAVGVLSGVLGGGRLGASLADAGDIDGDGYGDLVVGAPQADEDGSNVGVVYLMLGGGF
jgi:hypothetical protein